MNRNWDFVGKRKIFFAISLSLMAIGLLFNIIWGVQLDTEFKGGTLVKYSYTGDINREAVESLAESTLGKSVEVQISDSAASDKSTMNLELADELSMDEQAKLDTAIKEKYPDNGFEKVELNSLKASMGRMFFYKCMAAIVLASVFLVIYVALRFRKIGGISAGVMALVALLHDILIAYFTFVVFRIPLDDNFVAVVLSILGYSLNDTIVIYDRVRENRRLMGRDTPIAELVNRSINQSFTRSFNTGLCTFIAITTVAVMALAFNLDSIVSFAVPMMLGVISGCYSTVCICGPLWVLWREHKEKSDAGKKPKSGKGAAKRVKA